MAENQDKNWLTALPQWFVGLVAVSPKKNRRAGDKRPVPGFLWPSVAAAGGLALILALGFSGASFDFIVLIVAMLALAGLLFYDIFTRRKWEHDVSARLDKYTEYHDRLVREVARTRNDIIILKEGLADMALSVEAQGHDVPATSSPEARMIETIVTQLGALGTRSRAGIGARPEAQHVLELEMAPPPQKSVATKELETEFDADFDALDDAAILDMIRHALRHDAIDVFMQPIVSLPQRKARLYEVFARLRAGGGNYLPAAYYIRLAEEQNMVPAIDNLLLLRCLQMLRDQGAASSDLGLPYVLNISATTLNDRSFMGDLVSFLSQNRRMAGNLVFEMTQAEFDKMEESVIPVLDGLSQLGCRFSMDRIRRRQINIADLKKRHIRFIKIDADWLLKEGAAQNGYTRIVRFKKQLDAAGIDLIVEKIEEEETLRELLDYNIDFGQGFLFGKPDLAAGYQYKKRVA